jgi:uncharacterized protein YxeA
MKKIVAGFVFVFIMIIALALSVVSNNNISEATEWVEHKVMFQCDIQQKMLFNLRPIT